MKTRIFTIATVLFTAVIFFSFDLPTGWHTSGSLPDSYEMGIDKGTGQHGKNSATIQSKEDDIQGFGTLMQSCSPQKYLGKQIKMTAYVKSENVTDWAALWLRVDKEGTMEPLAFDNMQDRPITGNTDWKKYEILLDVPSEASNIAYGAMLIGSGQIWFDNVTFEVVDNADNPKTTEGSDSSDINKKELKNTKHVNPDFED